KLFKLVRRCPADCGWIITGARLAASPPSPETDDRIVGRYLSILAADHFGHVDYCLELRLDPGLLHEFAASRIAQRLPELPLCLGDGDSERGESAISGGLAGKPGALDLAMVGDRQRFSG